VFKLLFKPNRPPLTKIETVIGSNTSFEGHLKCDGNVRIEGLCEGGIIETVGNVVVARQARVAAKIIAEHVSVAGEVTGAIYARGRLEILSTGRVSGDVRVANFYKDEAAILSGQLTMGEDAWMTGVDEPVEDSDSGAEAEVEDDVSAPAQTEVDKEEVAS